MKVAIPVRNGRVSPVFDAAGRLIVVEFRDRDAAIRSELPIGDGGARARASLLRELGVTILICGAISNRAARFVEQAGIEVRPWIVGNIEDVIEGFRAGSLDSDGFTMPGCRRGRGNGRGRCGGGRRNSR
jgi:predicted Fe-Mo cluster-binding NifX family protein